MKMRIKKYFIPAFCLVLLFAAVSLIFTGSVPDPEVRYVNAAGIAVVDKKGVGQTLNEVSSGMNSNVFYDQKSHTLLWNIGKEYKLVENYTYYITFKVENGEVINEECIVY